MKPYVLLLALASALPAQNQHQVVTNETVAEMVRAGVATDLILDVIHRSECRFHVDPANLIWLKNSGVPDEIVRAMAARAAGRSAAGGAAAAGASVSSASAPPLASPPEQAAAPAKAAAAIAGTVEDWEFGLGTVALQFGGGLSIGKDWAPRTVAPSAQGELDVGLHRYLSLVGAYAWHALGKADVLSCAGVSCVLASVKVRAHEMTGGVKLTIPTSTRFTPFFTGSAGILRASAGADVLGITVGASDSVFIAGPGAGFRVHLTHRLGLDYDARVLFGRQGLFYGRTTLGLLVRLN
ncbi:MAG TPA: hypothetical protein VNJ11_00360 [Bryobacteraceae bacterium]|nr:hypothetical protein [Bryobacteraceae bacterium]